MYLVYNSCTVNKIIDVPSMYGLLKTLTVYGLKSLYVLNLCIKLAVIDVGYRGHFIAVTTYANLSSFKILLAAT